MKPAFTSKPPEPKTPCASLPLTDSDSKLILDVLRAQLWTLCRRRTNGRRRLATPSSCLFQSRLKQMKVMLCRKQSTWSPSWGGFLQCGKFKSFFFYISFCSCTFFYSNSIQERAIFFSCINFTEHFFHKLINIQISTKEYIDTCCLS